MQPSFSLHPYGISALGFLGTLALGSLAPASAITLTTSASTQTLACDLKVVSSCSLNFDNFNSNLINGVWAVKGRVTAANANLGGVTGTGFAAKVLTLTAADFQYRGTATQGTFSGLSFSHFFDLSTTTTTTLFGQTRTTTNPSSLDVQLSHQLSGKFTDPLGVNSVDRVASNVNFTGGLSATDATRTVQITNGLTVDSFLGSGTPNSTLFGFTHSAQSANLGKLYNANLTVNLGSLTLAKGDTMSLPASDCVILGFQDERGNLVDGNRTIIRSQDGSIDRGEELCSEVARMGQPPVPVPEPTGLLSLASVLTIAGWTWQKGQKKSKSS